MRKSQDQIEQEYIYTQEVKKNREMNGITLSAENAERLAQAVVGSEYTNPEITAIVGLSPTPVDMAEIHKAARQQYMREMVQEDRPPSNVTVSPLVSKQTVVPSPSGGSHGSYRVHRDGTEGKTLLDILKMKPEDFMVMPGHKPKWWEVVDPTNEQGVNWRNLSIPEIKTPDDLLNLTEPQLIKFYMQKPEQYAALTEKFRPTMVLVNKKGELVRGGNVDNEEGPVIADPKFPAGHKSLIDKKFPTFAKLTNAMETQNAAMINASEPTGFMRDLMAFKDELSPLGWVASLPFKTIGMMTPDHVGPAGGVEAGGVNIPLRLDLTQIGTGLRAASKTATAALTGAAQFTGSNIEFALSTQQTPGIGPLQWANYLWGARDPEGATLDNYYKTVIQGNIISQIIKRGLDPNKNLDLGAGFFPEGPTMEEARRQHDAGLPKIAGKTWSAGRSVQEPFIQAGLIDRNGYAAQFLSGLVDLTFDLGTDPSMYFDPVQGLIKGLNLGRTGTTKLLEGAAAETVGAEIAAERLAIEGYGGVAQSEKVTAITEPLAEVFRTLSREFGTDSLTTKHIFTNAVADIVRDAWKTKRESAGLSTIIPYVDEPIYDVSTSSWIWGAENVPVENLSDFGGYLPKGTVLPPEVQAYAQQQADSIINRNVLETMDSYPPIRDSINNTLSDAILEALGIVRTPGGGIRTNAMAIDAMPHTRAGRAALSKLASFDNVGQLYDAFLGNIPIGAAQAIQDIVDAARLTGAAPDLNAVHKVLVDGILSADPMYFTFNVPGMQSQWINQTGAMIANKVSGKTRQFATMPGSSFFAFDDPMASIKDMNNLMIVMKVPTADRHLMLAEAIRAVTKEGAGARFDLANQWMKTMVGPSLRKAGAPEEWIDAVTKWSGWSDGIHKWSMDAIGRSYPAPWLEDGSTEIFRTIDGLNQGFLMIHPDMLKQVIRETTNLWKAFKPARGNAVVETLLSPKLIKQLDKIQGRVLKPLALGAPLPIRMATRIVPDELLRVAVTGNLSPESLHMLGTFGHVNYTTHGVAIRTAKEITKMVPLIDELDFLQAKVSAALAAGDIKTAGKYQGYIDKIVEKYGTKAEIQSQIDVFNQRINTVLPGSNRTVAQNVEGLMADERTDPRVLHYERSNLTQHASATDEPAKWIDATGQDIVKMNASPEYPPIAEAMLGGPTEIAKLADRFLNGDLKPLLEKFIKSTGKRNASWDWTDIDNVEKWVQSRILDIETRTVKDFDAIEAISTGTINGVPISLDNTWDVYKPSPELRQHVADNLHTNPDRPEFAPFHATEATKVAEERSKLMTKGFDIYRDASAKFARNPYTQYHKWQTIIEMMPIMDPAEAKKMVDAIDKSDAPKWLKERLGDALPDAAGTATRNQVELLGEMAGQQKMTELLYDSTKKSYFGYRHSLQFGFFDAWKEQWAVWTRQLAQQPTVLYKAGLAQQALENTPVPEFAGGMPGQNILFTDPDTGKQAVTVPFSRQFMELIGLEGNESIPTKNLTLLGQAVPGAFGIGGIIWDSILPTTESFSAVRNALFPFGDPKMKSDVADYFLPAWAQGFGVASTQLAKGIPGVNKLPGIDNIQQFFGSEQNDVTRSTALNAVLTNLASQKGNVPITDEERTSLLEEAQTKTNLLLIWKSVFKIFSPGASITKYYEKLGPEYVTQGQVLNDLRNMTNTPDKSYGAGVAEFLNKYGPSAWVYLAGSSESYPGLQPTKEFGEWAKSNGGLVNKYPLVGAFLGPQDGVFAPGVYTQQRNLGQRSPRPAAVKQDIALNNLAWSVYNTYKDNLVAQGVALGLTPEQAKNNPGFQSVMKQKADELKGLYPMWNPAATAGLNEVEWVNQKRQIERMVKDPKVVSLPAGQALKEYWDFRTDFVAQAKVLNPAMANDAWRNAVASAGMRQKLTNKGEGLVAQYPEFKGLWERILSSEFLPPELEQ